MSTRKGILEDLKKLIESNDKYKGVVDDLIEDIIYHYKVGLNKDKSYHIKAITLLYKRQNNKIYEEIAEESLFTVGSLKNYIKDYNEIAKNIIEEESQINTEYKELIKKINE